MSDMGDKPQEEREINPHSSSEEKKAHPLLRAFPIDIKGLYEQVDEALPHSAKRWWWCWGGLVGLLLVLQIVTGLLLAAYYRAEPETAYASVKFITETARYGCFIRSLHQWGATFMIIFLFLHMVRVFVTGAFRNYRWGAWMVGMLLLATTLGMGFTGYSLVYEQLSYWAITVTANLTGMIPVVGAYLKQMFLAGDEINSATLSRLYALHVQVMPATIVFLSLFHLFFIRLMGMHVPGNKKDVEEEKRITKKKGAYHFFPDHMLSEIMVFLYLILIICLLSLVFPATMGEPANPLETPEHIKPEWYFYSSFHLLKLVPGTIGVSIMMLIGLVMFLWPVLDHYVLQKLDRLFKEKIEIGILLGSVFIAVFLIWAVMESY